MPKLNGYPRMLKNDTLLVEFLRFVRFRSGVWIYKHHARSFGLGDKPCIEKGEITPLTPSRVGKGFGVRSNSYLPTTLSNHFCRKSCVAVSRLSRLTTRGLSESVCIPFGRVSGTSLRTILFPRALPATVKPSLL